MLFRWPHASQKMSASHQIRVLAWPMSCSIHIWLVFLFRHWMRFKPSMCQGLQWVPLCSRCNNTEQYTPIQTIKMCLWTFGGVIQKESRRTILLRLILIWRQYKVWRISSAFIASSSRKPLINDGLSLPHRNSTWNAIYERMCVISTGNGSHFFLTIFVACRYITEITWINFILFN